MFYRLFFLMIFYLLSFNTFGQVLNSLEDVMVNGIKQKILIQGYIENPLILYLHGGPGYSSILESHYYTDLLKQQSLFVQWDQRGTGYSFNENIDTSTMSMNQFVEDTKELTDYLLKRFNKKKLYLLGHSWGSALGFYTIIKYPDRYYAFIGAGQVIDRKNHIKNRIDWVGQKMIESKDTIGLETLKKDSTTNAGFIWKYGGIMHNRVDIDSIKKTSPYYTIAYIDLIKRGVNFSEKYIPEEEQNEINLTSIKSVTIPIYFFLGRYDWLTPTSYPANFLKNVKAPDKKIIWFENSAHLMMIEEPQKFQKEIIKLINQTPAHNNIGFERHVMPSDKRGLNEIPAYGLINLIFFPRLVFGNLFERLLSAHES